MLRFLFNLLSGKIRRFASFMCVSLFMLTAVGGLEPSPVAAQVQIKGYVDFYEYNSIPGGSNGTIPFSDELFLSGWACVPDEPNRILRIDVYRDTIYLGSLYANQQREAAVGNECGGNSYHGFSGTINFPATHQAFVIALPHSFYAVYSDVPLVRDTLTVCGGYC